MLESKTDKIVDLLSNKVNSWLEELLILLPNLAVAVVIIIGFYGLGRLVKMLVEKGLARTKLNQSLIDLTGSSAYVAVNIFGLFIALEVLHLDKTVTSLLAGVGVLGLALGFAFQSTAANYVSGIILAFRSPFHIGELVQSGDVMGKVRKINLRSTMIRTFQGTDVVIPNKDVLQTPIFNYSRSGERRIDLACGISYGDDLEAVKKITTEAIQKVDRILKDKGVEFFYNEFGSSSINFIVTAYTQEQDQLGYLKTQSDMVIALKQAFDQNDITIPFPIRTLDFGIKGGEKLNEMVDLSKSSKKD